MSGTNEKDVLFRVMGDTLDPNTVTALMGIPPERSYSKGEPVPGHPERYYHTGYWSISSQIPQTSSIETMIEDLLEVLEPRSNTVRLLIDNGWSIALFCGVFAAHEAGELIDLSTDLMRRMVALGVRLILDIYPVCED